MRKGCKKEKYCVNHDYFKKWSHDMAYILGFIVADGNVQKNGNYVKIEVKPGDVKVLEFVRDTITPGYRLRQSRSSEIRWYPASAIIKRDLAELGVFPAKTGYEVLPPSIPRKYLWDFIRGLFDGDGTVSDNSIDITSNSKSLLDKLCKITGTGYLRKDRMNWRWVIEEKSKLRKFYNNLYATGGFSLERKKVRACDLAWGTPIKTGRWTAAEDKFLLANCTSMTRYSIGLILGRKTLSVKNRLYKLRKEV